MNFVKITHQSPHNRNFNNNDIWYGYLEDKIYDAWYEFVRLKVNDEVCTIVEKFPIDTGYAIDIDDDNLIKELNKLVTFS